MDEWRSWVYLLLAQVFRAAPDRSLLNSLAEERLLSTMLGELGDVVLSLHCELVEQDIADADMDEYLKDLQGDFARLFIGPGHLLAPPWESVYRSEERLMFGEHTLAVRELYRSYGIQSKQKNTEPEDHVALELEFMSFLCRASKAAGEKDDRYRAGQRAFLGQHLLAWTPDFCADVIQHAESRFYRELAQITSRWLAADAELLSAEQWKEC